MTIIDALGIVAVPGTVPTGNLLWVDAVSGNDSLARRGCLTVPFKTLTAAKNAATSGDTIMVMPGTYNENDLLKNGVNWHFLLGAQVNYSTNAAGGIFDTGGSTKNCVISGHGKFQVSNARNDSPVVRANDSASTLFIEAQSMVGGSGSPCVRCSSATSLSVVAHDFIVSGNDAIEISGGNTYVETGKVHTSYGIGIKVSSGAVFVKARYITCSVDPAIYITGGQTRVRAHEINASSDPCVLYDVSGASLHIFDARVVSGTAESLYFETLSSGVIQLVNCVLIAGGSYCMDAGDAGHSVYVLNGLSANVNYNSTNITPLVDTPIVDGTLS